MKKLLNYLILMVLLLSALLPVNVALASNTTLAEYIGTVRIFNNSTSAATDVFTVFNLTTQDLIDGDFCWQNVTNSSMLTNGGGDTEYMPAPGATNAWCVYVPSIIAKGSLDYKLHLGGNQDMDGDIRYFPHQITGMTTLENASLELGSNLETFANNWTIEQSGFTNTTVGTGMDLVDKGDDTFTSLISAAADITSGVYGSTTSFQYHNAGDANALLAINAATDGGQTFTTTQRHYITNVRIKLQEILGTTGTLVIALQATVAGVPTGVDLVYDTIDANTIVGAPGLWYQFDFTPYLLEANTVYAIAAHSDAGDPLTNFVEWRTEQVGTYAGGQAYWPITPPTARAWDGMFEEWGFVYVTATGVASDDHVVKTDLGLPDFAPGNTLHFEGTINSGVDCGIIYSAQANLWLSVWFRLDAPYAALFGQDMVLFSKVVAGNERLYLKLDDTTGAIIWRKNTPPAVSTQVFSTQTSWAADTWYHVLASTHGVQGMRLIIDGGVPVTNADANPVANGGTVFIGKYTASNLSPIGEVNFVTVGTDELTALEETNLSLGYTPGDETDLWYLDEGNGTAIKSYGSAANPGTATAANTWEYSTAMRNFIIYVGSTAEDGHHVIDATDTANDWGFLLNGAMPFMEYQEITVDGVQQQYIEWENNAATFTDASGQGNDASPTFRILSSDPDVSAELISFTPVSAATASNWSVSQPSDMIGDVVAPSEMFNETVDTGIPGTPFVEDVMSGAGVPSIMFYVPLLMLGLCIIGLVVGKFSLLAQLIIMTIIIFAAAGIGIPAWIGLIFLLDGLAFVLASKQFGW